LPPPKTFTDWINLITAAKGGWTYSDFAQSWLNGAQMLLRNGTTTVADFENVPELLPEIWDATPLRVFSFLEMTGIRARRDPGEILREAVEKIDSLSHPRCSASLSPHAPYSTVPELLRLSVRAARERGRQLCIHVAESAQEFEMFMRARGEMFNWMQRNTRDMSDCGLGSPKICSPFTSTCWRAGTPRCSANIAFTLFIARAAMIISVIRRFCANGSPVPASTSASARTAWPPFAKSGNKTPNSACSRKCASWRPTIQSSRQWKFCAWPRSTARARLSGPGKSASFQKMPWPI